ncbi:hypothetical protein [Ethanoligenens sp.]|uniref:hypothetical protein n=1 Tax=Ethanoligenens sp. TaxID=2099655 RepID=UPI0039EAD763
MSKAWYIIASRKQDELELLLDRKDIDYFNPTGIQARTTRQKLQLQEQNIMGGYVFAYLDISQEYYYLKHNEMFYGNVIAILGMDNGIAGTVDENEVIEWRQLAAVVSVPLRLRFIKGKYCITNKGLHNTRIVHYYRRKLSALIEVMVAGKIRKLMVAAYDVGNRSAAALELASIYKNSLYLLKSGTGSRFQRKRRIAAFLETVRENTTNIIAELEKSRLKSHRITMMIVDNPKQYLKDLRRSAKYRMVSYGRWRIAPFNSDWLYVTRHNFAFAQRFPVAG